MNSKQILIVEDEVILALSLKMQIENEGHSVCGRLTSGEAAIEFVQETKPDVILMDISLSGEIDGIVAAQAINKIADTSIIFMTGYDEPEFKERAEKLNPTAYLIKPVNFYNILPLID